LTFAGFGTAMQLITATADRAGEYFNPAITDMPNASAYRN